MSELALKLIAKEKVERTGKLDLSHYFISGCYYPKEIFELTWLEELSLPIVEYNADEIRAGISVQFYKLPNDFSKLVKLKSLTIGKKGYWGMGEQRTFDCSSLSTLKNLKVLNIHYHTVDDISFLAELSSITELSLQLTKITDTSLIGKLYKLKKLDLRHSVVEEFSFLEKFKNLEELNLDSMGLTDISAIPELKKLRTLSLSLGIL